VINAFSDAGGTVITYGRSLGALGKHQKFLDQSLLVDVLAAVPAKMTSEPNGTFGLSLQKTRHGYALHIVNYNYNLTTHRLDPLSPIKVKLNVPAGRIQAHSFPENASLTAHFAEQTLTVENAGIYSIIEF
jgi:hypothetical protein